MGTNGRCRIDDGCGWVGGLGSCTRLRDRRVRHKKGLLAPCSQGRGRGECWQPDDLRYRTIHRQYTQRHEQTLLANIDLMKSSHEEAPPLDAGVVIVDLALARHLDELRGAIEHVEHHRHARLPE